MIDPKALFIGPYGENSSEFRDMMQLVLEDIIQWRRNFHPGADRLILRDDKENIDWKNTTNKLYKELDSLLGDMKGSIPFHNPHFIGHMHSDLAIPALLGYAIGQLYNQNNVVGESSPITTAKEIDFISYLCEMVGYPPHEKFKIHKPESAPNHFAPREVTFSTGHLCSGGTTANLEALWLARNLKYFPITLKFFFNELKKAPKWENLLEKFKKIQVKYKEGSRDISSLSDKELFSLSTKEILDVFYALKASSKEFFADPSMRPVKKKTMEREYGNLLKRFSVRSLGISKIHEETKLPLPVVLVPQSRHYSWEKAADIIGLGTAQIVYIKVDNDFKVDVSDLRSKYDQAEHVLMTVAVVGSTEEGAIDPVAQIAKELDLQNTAKGKGSFFHIDAAYGGYFASIFNGVDETTKAPDEIDSLINTLLDSIKEDVKAMAESDSITIDPHKLGYVPYAAGAILYRDERFKPFIEKKAPYLASDDSEGLSDTTNVFLGASSLEGSRSGAAALSCYLTSKVIDNNISGYGELMLQTFASAQVLARKLKAINDINGKDDFKVIVKLLYEPATNIVCFVASVKGYILTPSHLNLLTKRLYEKMKIRNYSNVQDFKFFISKTELKYFDESTGMTYKNQIDFLFNELDITYSNQELLDEDFQLEILRSVQMNPMLESQRDKIFDEFIEYLESSLKEILPEVLLEILLEHNKDRRLNVLWIENQARIDKLRRFIMHGSSNTTMDLSRYINIDFMSWQPNGADISTWLNSNNCPKKGYDIYIVDLNLTNNEHKEWFSGINVISEIKKLETSKEKQPLIFVYSQFLNDDFTIENKKYPNMSDTLKSYFLQYANINGDCLIAKTINKEKELPEETDLEIIVLKLARLSISYLQKANQIA